LLWEQYREIARLADTAQRPADYRQKLAEAEQLADTLRQELKSDAASGVLDATFKRVSQNCVACHKQHRNE
jgi:mono/diheme cytochrome c family protein